MKFFSSLAVFTIVLFFYSCNNEKPSRAVLTNFHDMYPTIASVSWEWDKEDQEWEASFKDRGQEIAVSYDQEGNWLETEKEIAQSDIPFFVRDLIEKRYPGFLLSEIEWIETPQAEGYEVQLSKNDSSVELLIDKSGNILKEEKETENLSEVETTEIPPPKVRFSDEFDMDAYTFSTRGRNQYFILEPGYQLILEGSDGEDRVRLEITILEDTEWIGNIETRVMEEKEMGNSEIVEISRNFVAFCIETSDIFYFGEDVDIYEDGQVVNHEGAWRADQKNCKAGILMPGRTLIGARYYQELAPGVAMDRAEIISTDEQQETPSGWFDHCLKTLETSALNLQEKEYKFYAPNIGLIREENLLLVSHGFFR